MKFFSLIFLLSLPLASFAKEGGNGGGVAICGKKIELYDFHGGRSDRGHNIKIWTNDKKISVDAYLAKALAHIKKDIPQVHDKVAEMVRSIMKMAPQELFATISIPVIQDATITVLGDGCRYEQAANWNERFRKLFINKDIYQKMDNLNKAGLIVHEAIYKLSRDTFVANDTSDLVRETVARIFSDEILTKADAEVIWSESARNAATRPWCDVAHKQLNELEPMFGKGHDEKLLRLKRDSVDFCLQHCQIAEARAFCQSKLGTP